MKKPDLITCSPQMFGTGVEVFKNSKPLGSYEQKGEKFIVTPTGKKANEVDTLKMAIDYLVNSESRKSDAIIPGEHYDHKQINMFA